MDDKDSNNNNNGKKRKVPEGREMFATATPAPALRRGGGGGARGGATGTASRRRSMIGAGARRPPSFFCPLEEEGHPRGHLGALDEDQCDKVYQEYLSAMASKLLLKKARARIASETDSQLSSLQHRSNCLIQDIHETKFKINAITLLDQTSETLCTATDQFTMNPLKDEKSGMNEALEALESSVNLLIDQLPTVGVKPVVMGNDFDNFAENSEAMSHVLLQNCDRSEASKIAVNQLQSILNSKLQIDTEHKSVEQTSVEAENIVIQDFSSNASSFMCSGRGNFLCE